MVPLDRMCIAPWHLGWDTRSSNTKGYYVHMKHGRGYHPYSQAAAPGWLQAEVAL